MARRQMNLPVSDRPTPESPAWHFEESYLLDAGADSLRTETTYRSALRMFADWLQHFGKVEFDVEVAWPLFPDKLNTPTILEFREWLMKNRSKSTVTTYMAAVVGYLIFLDGRDQLPEGIQLGKLQRQMSRRRGERNMAEGVIDLDVARQSMPRIVQYYDELPLPETNDRYNRRLSLLRDRAKYIH